MLVRLFSTVYHRRLQAGIQSHQLGQVLRIHPVALARDFIDQPQLAERLLLPLRDHSRSTSG